MLAVVLLITEMVGQIPRWELQTFGGHVVHVEEGPHGLLGVDDILDSIGFAAFFEACSMHEGGEELSKCLWSYCAAAYEQDTHFDECLDSLGVSRHEEIDAS